MDEEEGRSWQTKCLAAASDVCFVGAEGPYTEQNVAKVIVHTSHPDLLQKPRLVPVGIRPWSLDDEK